METTIENLLKIEGSKLEKSENVSLVFVYGSTLNAFPKIYYKFYNDIRWKPNAVLEYYDETLVEIHFFETVEDVINQIYYITGEKVGRTV